MTVRIGVSLVKRLHCRGGLGEATEDPNQSEKTIEEIFHAA